LVLSMSDQLGSVKPIVPRYETSGTAWEPTIDSSDSNQTAAGDDYTSYYGGTPKQQQGDPKSTPPEKSGNEPSLRMAYTTSPHIIPLPKSKSSDGPTAMESGAFSIELSTLRSAEQTCLDATSEAIDAYGTLKDEVNKAANDDNFFGQKAGTMEETSTATTGGDSIYHYWQPDKYDDESQQFADAIIPQMKNLLNGVGSAIEAMGAFTALITDAGQSYATMDANSAFTDG
jgi:hypothetical protein